VEAGLGSRYEKSNEINEFAALTYRIGPWPIYYAYANS